MKAKVVLYKSDKIKTDFYPIKLVVTHQGKTVRKTIGSAKISQWNEIKSIPAPSHPDYSGMYSVILNIRSLALKYEFRNMTDVAKARDYLLQIKQSTRIYFYQFAQKRIDFMINQNRIGNSEAYACAIKELKKYKETLFVDEITSVFLENFKLYKLSERKILKNGKEKSVSKSAIRTYLYEIRAIYNYCIRINGLVDTFPFKGLFLDLKVRKRRIKNVYILKPSFKKLQDYKPKLASTQRTIDLTLLQFYLGGLDLVDLYYLKKAQINNDRVYLKRTKLGEKAEQFNVKLFDCAKKIIAKYSTDNEYVFPWRKDRTGYKTFRSTHNKSLKALVKKLNLSILPVDAPFTTKAVRHSFATIAKFNMIDVDIIRELMGHERNDIDTIYKDLFPEDVRDEAHFKIINILE